MSREGPVDEIAPPVGGSNVIYLTKRAKEAKPIGCQDSSELSAKLLSIWKELPQQFQATALEKILEIASAEAPEERLPCRYDPEN